MSSTIKAASDTAASLQKPEGREDLKAGVYSGLTKAKDGLAAGAGVAMETSSQVYNGGLTKAKEGLSAGAGMAM